MGCPRNSPQDDPFPSNGTCSPYIPPSFGTYNGMSYAGCYAVSADGPGISQIFPYKAYDNNTNTIDQCTSTCLAAGYSLAGLSASTNNGAQTNGTVCSCANTLGYQAEITTDNACYAPCSGNSNQTCGSYGRYSVYSSSGNVTVKAAPTVPAAIGNYISQGCYNESAVSGSRALSSARYANPNMTLEMCANLCSGYEYFGAEYADECYCGSQLASDVGQVDDLDCIMQCSGNEFELCGAASRLTVYKYNGTLTPALSCPTNDGQNYTTSSNITYTVQCGEC